jgi:3-oxoacyl-[acyl-carrier protein] reductase
MAGRRIALITGGSRGIGLGIARSLAAEGWHLAINGVREPDAVEETLEELRALGVEVLYARGDVSRAEEREAVVSAVRERFGALHLLVNNAGISSRDRGTDLLEASEENLEALMRINLQGPHFLTQRVARWMIEQQKSAEDFAAAIVNIGSISAAVVSTVRGDYCLSKAALSLSTKLWATRLAEYGIPVYEIRPGIIRTDMTAGSTEKYDRFIEEGNLLEARWGTPEDLGRATAMLARGDLPYATGQTLTLDGGLTLRRL